MFGGEQAHKRHASEMEESTAAFSLLIDGQVFSIPSDSFTVAGVTLYSHLDLADKRNNVLVLEKSVR